jgi:ApaG protein
MKNWNRIKSKFLKILNSNFEEQAELMERPDYIYSHETHAIEVCAQPTYVKERSFPEKDFYFYAYHITITNHSDYDARLLRRTWLIRNGNGIINEIEGPGVIGQTPIIKSGETFEYTSYCHLPTPSGNMRGSYLFEWVVPNSSVNESTEKFNAQIPLFFLRLPESFIPSPNIDDSTFLNP